MSGISMQFMIVVECENCDESKQYEHLLDMHVAARQKKLFTGKWIHALEGEVKQVAAEEGWLISKGHSLCPKCAEGFENGEIKLDSQSLSAKGFIDDYLFSRNAKR